MSIDDLPNYIDEYFQPEWNWKRKDISTEMLESEMAELLFNNVEKSKLGVLLTPGQGTRTGRKTIITDNGYSNASIASENDVIIFNLPENIQKALSFSAYLEIPDESDEGTLHLIDFTPKKIGLFCGNLGTNEAHYEVENQCAYPANLLGVGNSLVCNNSEVIAFPIFSRWLPIPSGITPIPVAYSKLPKKLASEILSGYTQPYRSSWFGGTSGKCIVPVSKLPQNIREQISNFRDTRQYTSKFNVYALRNLMYIWEDFLTSFYSRIGGHVNELYKLINSDYTPNYIAYRLGGQSEFGSGRRIHPDLFFSHENNPFDFYETKTQVNPWLHLPDDSEKTNNYVKYFGSHLSLRFIDLMNRTEDNPYLFDFKNDKGYTTLKLLKWLDEEENCFHVVPVQCWQLGNTSHNAVYATYNYSEDTPVEKRLPIYNLNLITAMLEKADDESDYHGKIVLTDSVAIAEHLQRCLSSEDAQHLVFTSFFCIDKQYNQINWLPLQSASERSNINIDLLITNHSGFSIEEAVVRANDLSSYLTKEYGIKINAYLGKEIDYSSNGDNRKNIDPAFSYMPHPVTMLTTTRFKGLVNEAKAKLAKVPERTGFFDDGIERPPENETTSVEDNYDNQYVIYPILRRNSYCVIAAPQGGGKSTLAQFLACHVVNITQRQELFPEMYWRIGKPRQDCKKNKVVLLDFENGASSLNTNRDSFARAFWGKESMEDNDRYYLFIDMLKSHTVNGEMKEALSSISFAKENWEQLFSIIDNAELYNDNEHVPHKQGDDNQTPDLLIIDHFAPFTLDTNANKNQSNFDLLMKKLLARYPGMAILVLHQENKAGDIRGDKSTFNNANPIILITRLSGDEVENEGLRQGQREVFKFEIAKQGRHQEDIREFWPRFVSTTKEGMYYCVFKGFTSKDGLVKVDESLRERIINDNATHAYEQMKRFDGKLTKEEIASILSRGEKTLNKDMGLK